MKKITFIIHDLLDKENQQGYRIHQYFPYLKKKGFTVQLFTKKANFLEILKEVRRADVTLIQRVLLSPLKLSLIRECSKRIVYDFDDAVMFGTTGKSSTRRSRFEKVVKSSDAVFCGNHFLLNEAMKYKNDNVYCVPTVVDTDEYPVKVHGNHKPFVVGWIGSSSTLQYLAEMKNLFLSDTSGRITFKIIADKSLEVPGAPILFERWHKNTETASLLSCDTGIMPVRDDMWSRGKCGLKLIQYMASGMPSVTHPVGVAQEMIDDGINGFLRADTNGWIDAIDELSRDVTTRERMGRAARETAEERYALKVWGPRVAEILDGL
ncbi:MAG: Glycosyl transferases group 1 [Syntrophorhabdus sp. PtaU1.Bin002]|nr:MAG: Glycosyl transferases group 1 [Syntrophorhabdus sp. PtaB.Bin006]OPY73334.1 MAG: Glycosyl transferases group 1 [Syntrophorhabdus sp. PtaU1.Bin002]